jgi:hypothetical protein
MPGLPYVPKYFGINTSSYYYRTLGIVDPETLDTPRMKLFEKNSKPRTELTQLFLMNNGSFTFVCSPTLSLLC